MEDSVVGFLVFKQPSTRSHDSVGESEKTEKYILIAFYFEVKRRQVVVAKL